MIPPLQPMRLRSIVRWLTDSKTLPASSPSAALNSRALELDDQMIQTFEDREDSLKAQLMKSGVWGTAQGMTQFPTDRMMLWQEVAAEYLPLTSDQPQET